MWDNPRQLNMLAGFLVGLTVLAFSLTALQLGMRSALWPVRDVTIQGDLRHTMRSEIEAALYDRVHGNFFSVDVVEVRNALERLPWVRRAAVRRVWPDRLEATLEEHVALARWGDSALVNTHGERFAGGSKEALPRFSGPRGSESEVTRRYARFGEIVAPLGTRVQEIILTPRLAWQLKLDNGVRLALGRDADAAETRLERFVRTAARGMARYDYVDLRYPNGFALRLPDGKG
ncbi:MAG TPA: cell division protein FtsQ/DivIB [Burkholderiales bacterium]|nr:cell division protein FtsQ/DivIB [Burkholderiales bacterium]